MLAVSKRRKRMANLFVSAVRRAVFPVADTSSPEVAVSA